MLPVQPPSSVLMHKTPLIENVVLFCHFQQEGGQTTTCSVPDEVKSQFKAFKTSKNQANTAFISTMILYFKNCFQASG